MKLRSVFAGFLSLVMAAVLLAGCANQMEPARKAIADIEAAVEAAGPNALFSQLKRCAVGENP